MPQEHEKIASMNFFSFRKRCLLTCFWHVPEIFPEIKFVDIASNLSEIPFLARLTVEIQLVRVFVNHCSYRYTNAALKISLYVQVHIKITPWKFHILDPKYFPVIYPWSLHFSYKIGYFWTCSIVYVCKQFLECTYLGKWKMLNCGICITLLFIWRLCGQTLVSAFVYL